jgi:hypothetical protein
VLVAIRGRLVLFSRWRSIVVLLVRSLRFQVCVESWEWFSNFGRSKVETAIC